MWLSHVFYIHVLPAVRWKRAITVSSQILLLQAFRSASQFPSPSLLPRCCILLAFTSWIHCVLKSIGDHFYTDLRQFILYALISRIEKMRPKSLPILFISFHLLFLSVSLLRICLSHINIQLIFTCICTMRSEGKWI